MSDKESLPDSEKASTSAPDVCEENLRNALDHLKNLRINEDQLATESDNSEKSAQNEKSALSPASKAKPRSCVIIIEDDQIPTTSSKQVSISETREISIRYRHGLRWRPYTVPKKIMVKSTVEPSLWALMRRVRLKGDVEALKLCLFDKREFPVPCSLQAARPPSPDCEGDLDELSEYFAHFVRVDLKMSSLAESMYV